MFDLTEEEEEAREGIGEMGNVIEMKS